MRSAMNLDVRRGHKRMSSVTCHISISLDGYVAGPNQSLENPLGRGPVGFSPADVNFLLAAPIAMAALLRPKLDLGLWLIPWLIAAVVVIGGAVLILVLILGHATAHHGAVISAGVLAFGLTAAANAVLAAVARGSKRPDR
jgi:hypothetical protein